MRPPRDTGQQKTRVLVADGDISAMPPQLMRGLPRKFSPRSHFVGVPTNVVDQIPMQRSAWGPGHIIVSGSSCPGNHQALGICLDPGQHGEGCGNCSPIGGSPNGRRCPCGPKVILRPRCVLVLAFRNKSTIRGAPFLGSQWAKTDRIMGNGGKRPPHRSPL